LIQGRYLQNEDENAILVSKTLAEYLSIQEGDFITLLGQRKDESMRQHSMTVVGIFSLGVPDIEKGMVYMNLTQAQTLYNLRGQVTEIAVSLKQVGQEETLVANLQALLPQYEVDSWKTLKPEITDTMQVKDSFTTIFGLVVLIIASIGILNLMLMAVFERTREMGVLAALGWKGRQIMFLFLLEGTMIGAVGAVIGGLLSWALVAYLGRVGIDFTFAQEMGGEAIALLGNYLYPSIPFSNIIQHVVSVVIIAAIASLIPAWQASRNEPANALHHI
jgi:ABC-type lipoprotein release transport system permease subunit